MTETITDMLQSIAAELETSPEPAYDDIGLVESGGDIAEEFASVFEDR